MLVTLSYGLAEKDDSKSGKILQDRRFKDKFYDYLDHHLGKEHLTLSSIF